jgi:hypothetical protein
MEKRKCVRCQHEMDEGDMFLSDPIAFAYISASPNAAGQRGLRVEKARACPNCGFLELYLDAEAVKKRITG